MRFINNQINTAVEAIRLEKPIVKLNKGYYNSITMSTNNNIVYDEDKISTVDKIVLDTVSSLVRLEVNFGEKVFTIKTDNYNIIRNILYTIEEDIIKFLRDNGGFANNRLSKIYKWYNKKISHGTLRNNEELTKDLYNIVKFIKGECSKEQIEAVRVLLNIIKDRYEPILGTV